MNSKKRTLFTILAIFGLVLITAGASFAFFNYAKRGTTDNTVTTGTITFLYTEIDKVGAGISIEEAFPMTDDLGKQQIGSRNVFNFNISSQTMSTSALPYEVTARVKEGSDLPEDVVKVYLTEVDGTEKQLLLDKFSNLQQTTKVSTDVAVEKILYKGIVPVDSSDYSKDFRLRLWIDEDADFSNGSLNHRSFTITVNVYSDGKVISSEDMLLQSSTEITTARVSSDALDTDVILTPVTGKDYNYKTTLPEEVTNVTLDIETANEDATVLIEKLNNLEGISSEKNYTVKKLSTQRKLDLSKGTNYFKVTVTSANGAVEDSYIIRINVGNTNACEYDIGKSWVFDYNGETGSDGSEQNFIVPCDGSYKLEVWGASGNIPASSNAIAAYGGYSTGIASFSKNTNLFINVGGNGVSSVTTKALGGYNGGGDGYDWTDGRGAGSGGGATHIALSSGLLSEISDKSSILIVAGGAGGVGNHTGMYKAVLTAGSGGGYVGGTGDAGSNYVAYGGTQNSGGKLASGSVTGAFGRGGTCTSRNCSGGGGGYYGGSYCTNYSGAGSGGSGYIGHSALETNSKVMYCHNCKENNGTENPSYKTISTTGSNADIINCPNGYSSDPVSKCAKAGHGYVKITYLDE